MAKSYHLTTFGCQMNEHDSERMKGMLESLGYREAAGARRRRPDPLQHLLDPREGGQPAGRAPRRGQAPQGGGPRARDRDRRLLVPVAQGPGLRAVPVRGRGVRPRPGAQARRVPHERQPHRAGLLRVRGLHRPPADEARARVPGLGADLGGLQLRVLVLHRAVHARPRGVARRRRARGRGGARGGGRRERGHAARPERLLLRARPAEGREDQLRRAARAWWTRSTGSSGSATRARTPRTFART